eukprot:COSAG05_NODE_6263_length_988_cov_6.598425_1_plen_69_part_00
MTDPATVMCVCVCERERSFAPAVAWAETGGDRWRPVGDRAAGYTVVERPAWTILYELVLVLVQNQPVR